MDINSTECTAPACLPACLPATPGHPSIERCCLLRLLYVLLLLYSHDEQNTRYLTPHFQVCVCVFIFLDFVLFVCLFVCPFVVQSKHRIPNSLCLFFVVRCVTLYFSTLTTSNKFSTRLLGNVLARRCSREHIIGLNWIYLIREHNTKPGMQREMHAVSEIRKRGKTELIHRTQDTIGATNNIYSRRRRKRREREYVQNKEHK